MATVAIRKVDPMTKARAELVMSDPFFGVLALRMRMKEDETCPTAWCDGVTIGYNPKYINSLSADERKGLLVHELMHPALLHHTRRGSRNPKKWNIAADFALNPLLTKYRLPSGALINPAFAGKSAEEIYNLLPNNGGGKGPGEHEDPSDENSADGPGNESGNDPGRSGEVRDAPRDGNNTQDQSNKQQEAEWKQALAQAKHVAKLAGKLPSELEKLVDDVLEPKVDWKATLRRFMTERKPNDYSWSKPNRRFIGNGLYLPSRDGEAAGPVVIGRDTSGSIYGDPEMLSQFMGEITAIVEDIKPSKIYVVDIDATVQQVYEFEPGDDLHAELAKAKGGGGTSFKPLWKWMEEAGVEPKCVVYLTDGYGDFPEESEITDAPILWAMTTDVVAPVGETLFIGC